MESEEDMMLLVVGEEYHAFNYESIIKDEYVDEEYNPEYLEEYIEPAKQHGQDIDVEVKVESFDEKFKLDVKPQIKSESIWEVPLISDGNISKIEIKKEKRSKKVSKIKTKKQKNNSGRKSPDYHYKWRAWKPVSAIKKLKKDNPDLSENELIHKIVEMMKEQTPREVPEGAIYLNKRGVYICKVCSKEIPRGRQAAVLHYTNTHGPRYMKCLCCGLEFRCKVSLTRHETRCKAEYTNLQLKARDIITDENKTNKGLNFYKFKNTEKYKAMLGQSSDPYSPSKYMCDQCPTQFLHVRQLKEHIDWVHQGIKSYQCDLCQRFFATKTNITVHIKRHYKQPTYVCYQCGKIFLRKATMQLHMLTHLGIKSFVCEVCGMAYSCKDALIKHDNRVHRGLPPKFACEYCDKRYPKRYLIREHVFKAHGLVIDTETPNVDGNYSCVCELCGQMFGSEQSLKQHEIWHDKLSIECKVCGSTFCSVYSLQRHTHLGHTHHCNMCEKRFVNADKLQKHLENVHGVISNQEVADEIEVQSEMDTEETKESEQLEETKDRKSNASTEPVPASKVFQIIKHDDAGVKLVNKDSESKELKRKVIKHIDIQEGNKIYSPNPFDVTKTIAFKDVAIVKDASGKEVRVPKSIMKAIMSPVKRHTNNIKDSVKSQKLFYTTSPKTSLTDPNVLTKNSSIKIKSPKRSPSKSKVKFGDRSEKAINTNIVSSSPSASQVVTANSNVDESLSISQDKVEVSINSEEIVTNNQGINCESSLKERESPRNPKMTTENSTTNFEPKTTLNKSPSESKVKVVLVNAEENLMKNQEMICEASLKEEAVNKNVDFEIKCSIKRISNSKLLAPYSDIKMKRHVKSPSKSKVKSGSKSEIVINTNSDKPNDSKVAENSNKNLTTSSEITCASGSKVHVVLVNPEENQQVMYGTSLKQENEMKNQQIISGENLKDSAVNKNLDNDHSNVSSPNISTPRKSERKRKIKVWD